MNKPDPVEMFLGVSRAVGPRRILGLGNGPVDAATIQAAMRMRIRTIESHPRAASREAAEVQQVIEAAGAALMASESGPEHASKPRNVPVPPSRLRPKAPPPAKAPVPPVPQVTEAHLTPFDRLVLAVLLAGGGWNSRTRGIIAGLASQVGLDSKNLQRVVLGLSKFVHQRGSKGTVDSAAEMPMAMTPLPQPGRIESTVGKISDGLAREVRGETYGSMVRLIIVFIVAALLLGIVLVQVLTAPTKDERSLEQRREVAQEKVARDMERERSVLVNAPEAEHVVEESTRSGVVLPAKYSRPPNFSMSRRPEAALMRLDRSGQYLDEFEDLARRLELDPSRLPEQKFSAWTEGVRSAASTWPLMDPGVREQFRVGMLAVLRQASDTDVAAKLLSVFELDPGAPIVDPLESWIRPFHGGMLALSAGRREMPPEVQTVAAGVLENVFETSALGLNSREGPFRAGASRTLDHMVPALVAITGVTPGALDAWEFWLVAQETVRSGSGLQEAQMLAIQEFLSSGRNLAEEGEPVDVVGRLISEIDWGPTGADPLALREYYADWLKDPRISSTSMWVMASLLDSSLHAAWYRPEFVPAPEAGFPDRERVGRLAQAAWPEPVGPIAKGNRVLVNAGLLAEYDQILPAIKASARNATSDIERMRILLLASRLVEAGALLVAEREQEAASVLAMASNHVRTGDTGVDEAQQVVGRSDEFNDGEWAAEFEKTSGNQRDQVELLRALRQRSRLASDLSPLDARVFAEQVWRGNPAIIRSTARSIAIEEFINGPILALELLDTSDRAPLNDATLEFVEVYTGEPMPSNSAEDAEVRMRRALARKTLTLLDVDRDPIDRLGEATRTALAGRIAAYAQSTTIPASAGISDVADVSADVMRETAGVRLFADPFPDTLVALDASRKGREWLAQTAPQRLVAALAAEADFLAYVVAADVPSARIEVADILQSSGISRSRASSAITQATLTLLEIAQLERLRLAPRERNPLGGVS